MTFGTQPQSLLGDNQWHRAGSLASVLATVSLLLEYGFSILPVHQTILHVINVLLVMFFLTEQVVPLVAARKKIRVFLHQNSLELVLLTLFAIGLFMGTALPRATWEPVLQIFHLPNREQVLFDYFELYLFAVVILRLVRFQQRLLIREVRPEFVLASSFAVLILTGTLLLLLPRASAKPEDPISFLDAFFTSTSAACVTGLAVRDTGTDFSMLGQWVIMVVFQLGGLGIMTFVAFLTVFSARSLPLPQMLAFKQLINARTLKDLRQQVLVMILATVAIEALGAACLFACLPTDMAVMPRVHWSLFHSVSAFCNAGFALQSDSLILWQTSPGMMVTFMFLIVVGGLGFLVIPDLVRFKITRLPYIKNIPWVRMFNARVPVSRMTVQTKMALVVTVVMLVIGFAGFWVLESHNTLAGRSAGDCFWLSAFQSVTTRTAGFNTVPIDKLHDSTLILFIALMVVGASPVSTGGGIKTVTLGVLLLSMRAFLTGRNRVEAFGRTLPHQVLIAALSVFVLYVMAATTGVFFLAYFDPKMTLEQQSFEVISALSTVGLSTGITPQLSAGSKLVLCALMFIGRIGPIALVLSVFQAQPKVRYEYPEEDVIVG